ncbi:MAG: hypothetical protein KA713_01715 [Chryseotalea sp. WA131a]|nr:MAG: hypothetical protein KA713_01715 [Chryseotalea sp. WA131a]
MIDFHKLDLVTCVDLRNTVNGEKDVFHLIYGSQLYGTIFAVYGKFIGNEVTVENKVTYEVSKIYLKLLNYKGMINIGFSGCFDFKSNGEGLNVFDFGVQGANSNIEEEYDFEVKLVVPKGGTVRLICNRTLFPLADFNTYLSKGDQVDHNGKWPFQPPNTPLFDSEFHERDGIDFYIRNPKPGMIGEDIEAGFVGKRCIQSDLNLIY